MNIDRMNGTRYEVCKLRAGDVFMYENCYYIVTTVKEDNGNECGHAYFNLCDGSKLCIPRYERVVYCPNAILFPWSR